MKFKLANKIQYLQYFGEEGSIKLSTSDTSFYTFISIKTNQIIKVCKNKIRVL